MDKVVFFYGGIEPLIRIVVVGTLAYISLLLLLRISGKRSLAQLNAFDFVVTIAIGSTLGRLITAKGVSLAESVIAFLTLLSLQYVVSWLTVRSSPFQNVVTASPSLLYFRGQFLHKAMQQQRVTQVQLLAAVRENRIASLQNVEAIVMESTGTIAVIKKETVGEQTDTSALSNIPKINH
ncbi:MAG: DUF421 domain-containing protein [Coleofasciculus sp. B1-GNL1-01]|uniref:DUF421 domain-containing protein n=1 Tax=Coleofasciculus sp. B1-GNL1-01 TaxID=3068484 RepID=UPI0032F1496C